jgi:hypothetical protein
MSQTFGGKKATKRYAADQLRSAMSMTPLGEVAREIEALQTNLLRSTGRE